MKVWKFASDTGKEYHTLSFLDHVKKLFTGELHILLTAFVESSLDGLIDVLAGPMLRFELDERTSVHVLVQLQEMSCWMMNIMEMC